ncbi:MAG: hypothetical protein WA802_04820 [Terracidiphilus sp.]
MIQTRVRSATGLLPAFAVFQVFAIATGQLLLGAAPQKPLAKGTPGHCTVQPVNYDGWKAEQLSNRWVKLVIVPQLGGRLMQVTFNGHDYLFVNDQLKGNVNPPDAEHHRWYNYGGDKIWPMPEGSQDEQHWAGAGGTLLDEGAFTLQVLSRGAECAVRLTGPIDPQIGQQYIRDIHIKFDSPVIFFHAVMKNVSGYPQTWSEQSVSQYNAAAPGDPSQFNPKFWGVTPANPSSVFPGGYHVRTGNETNPGDTVSDGLFRVHWNDMEGEVWTDSPAGWLAVVDGTTGFTMVERNHYDPRAIYPGQTTMLFYTSGNPIRNRKRNRLGESGAAQGSASGQAAATATQPADSPASGQGAVGATPMNMGPPVYYMEAEIDSPMVELAQGESYAMDTTWYPTRMGEAFKTATYGGVVGTPLAAAASHTGLTLTGDFGVFYAGSLVAHYYDRGGSAIGTAKLVDVTPIQEVQLQSTVQAPAETFRVSVHLLEKSGVDRGPLGEAFVNPPPPAPQRR